jgi:hypothetical protein
MRALMKAFCSPKAGCDAGGAMKAYVLIQTDGHREPPAQRLRALAHVDSAEDVTGPFDAIALVRPRSTQHLMDEILREIRTLPGVTRALPVPLIPRSEDRPTSDLPHRHSGSRDEAA